MWEIEALLEVTNKFAIIWIYTSSWRVYTPGKLFCAVKAIVNLIIITDRHLPSAKHLLGLQVVDWLGQLWRLFLGYG